MKQSHFLTDLKAKLFTENLNTNTMLLQPELSQMPLQSEFVKKKKQFLQMLVKKSNINFFNKINLGRKHYYISDIPLRHCFNV